ncbi:GTPase domain-containing protein [Escherichia coli]|uniref:GTPase domain-containing protein n=1 Tax=Escherichia coli TaxID=562 RepID=UPI001944844F|nr:GTPase domain-containing protein [Escherichia coli]ELO4812045.1 GTPase domain-containing protein [Escherichia coli]MCQ1563316.1 hypothetical protein [Escherichia coli]MDD8895380.1 hypothetical protein [Escherichia coli]MDD8908089.1 hypothetical protein [Escherichia coli]MDT0831400.1 hypothetical protein [Escherichia coli]
MAIEWTTAASVSFRLGKQGYDNRFVIQKFWTKLKAYLDIGETQIVVTGHSGVGKTNLANQMHGRARDIGYKLPSESKSVEVADIQAGNWAKLVRVLPGQDGYRTKGSIDIFQDNDSLEGVIHLVDYGYSKPRNSLHSSEMIKDGISTIEQLRIYNLKKELQTLSVMLTDVRRMYSNKKRPKWIIIAVNKVDLYSNDRDDALEYYHPDGSSEFSRLLREFLLDIGSMNISIHVVQTCAYEQDFEWNNQSVKSELQRQEQNHILSDFMTSLAAISEGEGKV